MIVTCSVVRVKAMIFTNKSSLRKMRREKNVGMSTIKRKLVPVFTAEFGMLFLILRIRAEINSP